MPGLGGARDEMYAKQQALRARREQEGHRAGLPPATSDGPPTSRPEGRSVLPTRPLVNRKGAPVSQGSPVKEAEAPHQPQGVARPATAPHRSEVSRQGSGMLGSPTSAAAGTSNRNTERTAGASTVATAKTPKVATVQGKEARKSREETVEREPVFNFRHLMILEYLKAVKSATTEQVWWRVKGIKVKHKLPSEAAIRGVLYDLRRKGFVLSASTGEFSVWRLSPQGARAVGHPTGRPATTNYSHLQHTLDIAGLTADALHDGCVVIGDAELKDIQDKNRANGHRVLHDYKFLADENYGNLLDTEVFAQYLPFEATHRTMERYKGIRRSARPDLVVFEEPKHRLGGLWRYGVVAYEVELNRKSSDEDVLWKLAGYAEAITEGRYTEVYYYCSDKVLRHLQRLIDQHPDPCGRSRHDGFSRIYLRPASEIPCRVEVTPEY